jgi:hypothetical protein
MIGSKSLFLGVGLLVANASPALAAQSEVEAYLDGESAKIAVVIRGWAARTIFNALDAAAKPEPGNSLRVWKMGNSISCVRDTTHQDAPAQYACHQLVD